MIEAGVDGGRRRLRSIPNPEVGGLDALREAGLDVEVAAGDLGYEARRQNEAWRTWIAHSRPFVTYKVAVTLDGRVTLPGSRWVSGEESRRLVHELRAASDAVAVGMGTVRADDPQLTARDVDAPRQPRRLAFGRGPLPDGSELELRTGLLATSSAPWPRRASSRCSSKAGRRSPPRSSRKASSTSSPSSSHPLWRATAHGSSIGSRPRSRSNAWRAGRSAPISC